MSKKSLPVLLVALLVAIPVTVTAQSGTGGRRRPVTPPVSGDVITILQTTDIHDHVNGSDHVGLDVDPVTGMGSTGAYARIAGYISAVRATAGHLVVLVDSGDWTMGTLYDLTLTTEPFPLYFISSMRYDCITFGNHEWDYTPKGLAAMLAAAQSQFGFQTPIVASNMNPNGDADLAPFLGFPIGTSLLKTYPNGMTIGFLGLMGEDAALDAPGSAPVSFTPLSSDYAAIQSLVDQLRSNGAEVVIALSHSGTNAAGTAGEDIDLARHVHGINVIASGHTHTPLAAAHAVTNGGWTTQVIDAGAFGTNVARLDLQVDRAAGTTTLVSYNNVPMTDASLTAVGAQSSTGVEFIVHQIDQSLNSELAPLLTQFFADYDSANVGKGIYHPVGMAAQDMVPNDKNLVLSPNGLGDLAADSVRNVPNAIIAQTLAAVGGNPSNLPGYDFAPFQMGVVATGVIRGTLPSGVPLTFADVYNILPLGISPDTSQALPIGYPLMSTYLDLSDVKKVLALQLVGQTNLVGSSYYLNISGIQYDLQPAQADTYFKYATAAAVLQVAQQKMAEGSAAALQAMSAMFVMGMDHSASLMAAAAKGNPYATAMIDLNDTNPDASQISANVVALGDVGTAALYGSRQVSALVVSKAVDAIGNVSGFAATDGTSSGSPAPLTGSTRVRTSVDLYALLLLDAVEAQFGVSITPYQSATGSTALSAADFPTLLGNRIDAAPATAGVQELKEWTALLSDVGTGLGGTIGPAYASTANFTQFPTFGSAVTTRNPSYPLAAIGKLVGTVAALQQAP